MGKKEQKSKLFEALAGLYANMEAAYGLAAARFGLSCEKCASNCCTSYFQHHTYIEWAYLWQGMQACPDELRHTFIDRARDYVARSRPLLMGGKAPRIMCPLNEQGLCQLYDYRLMICRLHGVPNSLVRPDGKTIRFPGCVPCQGLYEDLDDVPMLDRTAFYKDLARLEMALLNTVGHPMPRVRLTLAEMLDQGPPTI